MAGKKCEVLFNVDRKRIHFQLDMKAARISSAGWVHAHLKGQLHDTFGMYFLAPQSALSYNTSAHTTDMQGVVITSIPMALNTNFILLASKWLSPV